MPAGTTRQRSATACSPSKRCAMSSSSWHSCAPSAGKLSGRKPWRFWTKIAGISSMKSTSRTGFCRRGQAMTCCNIRAWIHIGCRCFRWRRFGISCSRGSSSWRWWRTLTRSRLARILRFLLTTLKILILSRKERRGLAGFSKGKKRRTRRTRIWMIFWRKMISSWLILFWWGVWRLSSLRCRIWRKFSWLICRLGRWRCLIVSRRRSIKIRKSKLKVLKKIFRKISNNLLLSKS